jgi:hypothetical protein
MWRAFQPTGNLAAPPGDTNQVPGSSSRVGNSLRIDGVHVA